MRVSLISAVLAACSVVIAGCGAGGAGDEPSASPEASSPAPSGGLATFDPSSDFPEAKVDSRQQDGFNYDGLHIKLKAAETMPVEEVTVDDFYDEFDGATPIRFTFDLVNVNDDPFQLDEFDSSAYGGENFYELEYVPGIADGEPVSEPLPRRVAGNNSTEYIVTYSLPDEHRDQPVLIEISPMFEAPVVEYYVYPESITEWKDGND